ncbi:MAG: rRNA maturation RNase YbeY [Actinomycetota bacterium]
MTDDDHPAILVSDRQSEPLDIDGLVTLARATLRGEGLGAIELSVSFVEEDEIEELHVRYMDELGPTDVLSFPLDADDVDEDGIRMLGDVVIAPSVAAANNPGDPGAELRLLLVHGILHLLGYDHEEDAGKAEMWSRQERYSGVSAP